MDESAQEFSKRELKKLRKEEEKKKEQRNNAGKKLLTLLGIVAVIGVVGYGLLSLSDPNKSFSTPLALQVESIDHVKGNPEAAVTLVEYGDYECPGCASFAPIVAQAAENFADDLKVVYRHFPLPNHPNSLPAAYAAEAAAVQGKFWEMNDLLFMQQREWMIESNPQAKFEEYAQSLELEIDKFKQDMESQQVRDKVQRDATSGMDSKVNATPTFYLNGEKVEKLPGSPQQFFELIQKEIDDAKSN